MVQLFNCQARPSDAVEPKARCGVAVSQHQPFCAEHADEYQALAERHGAASVVVEELDATMEGLLGACDTDTGSSFGSSAEEVQGRIEEVRRYLQSLGERVETQSTLSRRFFSEPLAVAEHRAQESLMAMNERRIALSSLLMWLRDRESALIEEEQRLQAAEEQQRAEDECRRRSEEEEDQLEEARRPGEACRGEGAHRGDDAHEPDAATRQQEEACRDEEACKEEDEERRREEARLLLIQAEGAQREEERAVAETRREEEEAAEKRRQEYKNEMRRRNDENRKQAEEERKKEEENRAAEPPRTETRGRGDGGSRPGGHGGLELAGRLALVGIVIGTAVILGVRNRDVLTRCMVVDLFEQCVPARRYVDRSRCMRIVAQDMPALKRSHVE
ncbi:hypothetical protein C8Q80DRAFT_1116983 [Daedaleopsis nitida]|nr:hypothetical protein C8Q80DRAFT_1116983 [Daedaleopsis nitida]